MLKGMASHNKISHLRLESQMGKLRVSSDSQPNGTLPNALKIPLTDITPQTNLMVGVPKSFGYSVFFACTSGFVAARPYSMSKKRTVSVNMEKCLR